MDTKQLIRVNPKISGNVKIVLGNGDDIHIESFDIPNFSNPRFKNYKVDPKSSYIVDIKNFLRDGISLPDSVLYTEHLEASPVQVYSDFKHQYESFYNCGCDINSDKFYKERYRMLSSLWIGDNIPDFFIVFKIEDGNLGFQNKQIINPTKLTTGNTYRTQATSGSVKYMGVSYSNGETFVASTDQLVYSLDGDAELLDITPPDINNNFLSDFISPSEIVKMFDMREGSKVGDYIRHLIKDINYKEDDIFIDNRSKTVDFYGIDTNRGVITTKRESIEYFTDNDPSVKEFDKFLSDGFKRNSLLCMRNLNMEFMFDDDSNTNSFAKYYGFYMNMKEIAKFYPDIERKTVIEYKKKEIFGNDLSIDLSKNIEGVVPVIIKNFYSLNEPEITAVTTTIKGLYYRKFGSFNISFGPSFDVSLSRRVGTLQDNNIYLIETDTTVSVHDVSAYDLYVYLKFIDPQVLTPDSRLTVSLLPSFDYTYDINGLGIFQLYPVPFRASHLCEVLVNSLNVFNSSYATSYTMDDLQIFGLGMIDRSTGEQAELPAIFRKDDLTTINVELPQFGKEKDLKTTASYFFVSNDKKYAKINNIACDQEVVEQDDVVLLNIDENKIYTYIEYFFNITHTQFTTITIGTDIGSATFNLYGPINMRRLIDAVNAVSSQIAPVLTKTGELITVQIGGLTFNFEVRSNKNYQTKLVLNDNDLDNIDVYNFTTTQVVGFRLTEAGRSMAEFRFTEEFDSGDYFQFKFNGKLVFDVFADDSCIGTLTGHAYKYFDTTRRTDHAHIAEAFNFQFRAHNLSFRAFDIQDRLFIVADNQGTQYNEFSLELFSNNNGFNDIKLSGGTDYSTNRVLVNEYPAIDAGQSYMALNSKYVKIISINRYVDNVNSGQDELPTQYVISFFTKSDVAYSYEGFFNILEYKPLTFSIGEIIGVADFDTDTFSSIYSRSHSVEYNKYYNVKKLIPGERYQVKRASYDRADITISHNNLQYTQDDIFTASAENFTILGGSPIMINVKYYDDPELIAFPGFNSVSQRVVNQQSANAGLLSDKLSFLPDIDNKGTEYDRNLENDDINTFLDNISSNNCKFVLTGSSDVRSNPYRISLSSAFGEMNYTPSFQDLEASSKYFTHEWYYLSSHPENMDLHEYSKENSYFSRVFDKETLRSNTIDYFSDYFNFKYPVLDNDYTKIGMVQNQKRYSVIKSIRKDGSKYVSTTLFRGVRVKFTSDYNMTGWKFSCILNMRRTNILEDTKAVEYESIVNETFKNFTIVITVNIDDYKVVNSDRLFGEYAYLYMMNSLRSYDVFNGFKDGLLVALPQVAPILVDVNDNVVSSIYATKLYVARKDFNNNSINFGQDTELDQQYKLLKDGGYTRIFMIDKTKALLSTQTNGYITASKYRIDNRTTISGVAGNTLTMDDAGIYIINLPGLSSGINVSPAVLGSIYNLSRLTWLNQDGGIGYMADIRRKISFGNLAKINREDRVFSSGGIEVDFLEPEKIIKSSTLEVSLIEKEIEGNPSITTKIPINDTRIGEKTIYRYSGGGTILLKDAMDFLDFNCYINVGNATGKLDLDKTMDTFSLQTTLMDNHNDKFVNYTLHDITPLSVDGSSIFNGFTLRGNYVFGLLSDNFGHVRNKWFHKVSSSNIISTTNPVYYNINEVAIEKTDLNVFLSNFDLKYKLFDRNTVRNIDWYASPRLIKNYFNTVLFGIEEQSDFSDWIFINFASEVDFDNSAPLDNNCHVYKNPTQIKIKINVAEILVHYYKLKLLPIFTSKFGTFPGLNEFMIDFIKTNITKYINISSKDLLIRKNNTGVKMESISFATAMQSDYKLSKTSVVANDGIATFTLLSDGNVSIVPYVSFGK